MKLKDYIEEDKPREKLEKLGSENLSDSELLSILLRVGSKSESVNELSTRILKENDGLKGLSELSLEKLCEVEGIKKSKATTILAAFEIGKRLASNRPKKLKLRNSDEIFAYYKNEFIGAKQEKFYALYFDTKMNLIKREEIFKGSIDNVEVHPRDVFREAISLNAKYIVVMHNHPSGDPTPSEADIKVTEKLKQVTNLLKIELVDHIIIGNMRYKSIMQEIERNGNK